MSDQPHTAHHQHEGILSRKKLLGLAAAIPRPLWRMLVWTFWIGYFAIGAVVLSLRYAVLPNIEEYRPQLERVLTESLGLDVRIAGIQAHWYGLRPHLSLHGLQINDREGRPALGFENVETVLAWSSLWHLQPRLARLEIRSPVLDIRRDAGGRIFVAGIPLNTQAEGTDFSDWLLAQRRIVVQEATIRWTDELRGAPPLQLTHVNFQLDNSGLRHRFGVTAEPPPELAARIDLRGDFRGEDLDRPREWSGQAYAELQYADLAVWRRWVDYPVELPRGDGAVRLWLNLADERIASATADVALRDVQLRLAPDLPMLDLAQLHGRLAAGEVNGGFQVAAKKLSLALRDGLRVEPTDFDVRWSRGEDGRPASGSLRANALDLAHVAHLASYLPLDHALRHDFETYAPEGRLEPLAIEWKGDADRLVAYTLDARFERLGLKPHGLIPGFHGLSGHIAGDEKGGTATVSGRGASFQFPAVFADPRIDLEHLDGRLAWTVKDGSVEAKLQELTFTGKDAAGRASGTYHSAVKGPGSIDLSAHLTRADGTAVWRYMPLVVSPHLREWLHTAITAGTASDATLRLKGDLEDFPFRDNLRGMFHVSAQVSGATLRYASGWPEITGINGSLLFEGQRMRIKADKGAIYGVSLGNVIAELPDLGANPLLTVAGKATGPLPEFLRFIDSSPVIEHIGGFTRDMSGTGNGNLALKLTLPLHDLDKTAVAGDYEFLRNRVTVDPELPPITEVAGRLQFTGSSLTIPGINGTLLGGALAIKGNTAADGAINIGLQGSLTAQGLRQQYGYRALDYLAGSAAYRGTIAVKKSGTEVAIESNLQGLASTLPEPLQKAASESLPLRYQRQPFAEGGAGARSLIRIAVGAVANAQVVRSQAAGKSSFERAAIGVGESPALPEKGIVVAASVKRMDLDFWRRLIPAAPAADGRGEAIPVQANLRAAEAVAFDHRLSDFSAGASVQGEEWTAQVASREAAGTLSWRGQGKGRLHARLKHLILSDAGGASPAAGEPLKELPGLDVVADSFVLNGMRLGRLELNADNAGGMWKADRVVISSPDGTLTGNGQWRGNSSQFVFKADVADAGKMLDRIGYPEALKRGTAGIEGKLAWAGPPIKLDYPSLSGTVKLDAARGQFNKLEPGVGRLLGILSLQSLPRRISLDFRDVFSDGFAFDSITGNARIDRGIMTTQNLQIRGPSAKVFMSGEVNLANETQNLRVRVQPSVGESVAVGAMIANPAIGLAALLAQKVLKDPLDQMLSFHYAITGSWSDPKVEKLNTALVKREEPVTGP